MTPTLTVTGVEIAAVVNRLADIVHGATERYGIYGDGRAPISPRYVLYSLFDLDPASYFTPENHDMALWAARWRQTRRDETREQYQALYDDVYRALVEGLPGDWRAGDRYTPEQVRDVSRQLTKE